MPLSVMYFEKIYIYFASPCVDRLFNFKFCIMVDTCYIMLYVNSSQDFFNSFCC